MRERFCAARPLQGLDNVRKTASRPRESRGYHRELRARVGGIYRGSVASLHVICPASDRMQCASVARPRGREGKVDEPGEMREVCAQDSQRFAGRFCTPRCIRAPASLCVCLPSCLLNSVTERLKTDFQRRSAFFASNMGTPRSRLMR
jgi:hypothetical protein